MPVERFFADQELTADTQIILEDSEFHHLAHVVRITVGEQIELVNGKGTLATAKLITLEKKRATLLIKQVQYKKPAEIEIVLAQAIPRINRLDFILEKGTELGMDHLWLFPGKLSERKQLLPKQLEHFKSVCISAMKQCGRLYMPTITVKPPLLTWNQFSSDATCFFGDLRNAPTLATYLPKIQPKKRIIFFIGPESGFSNEEIAFFDANKILGVKLHSNILRTDTASLTALSLIAQIT